MQFSFMVGITEPHRVDFSFDQFRGLWEIKVDGVTVVDEVRTHVLAVVLICVLLTFSSSRTVDIRVKPALP